jgi:dihydroorotase/N-acyl-D-amino-acid deacylase
MRGIRSIAVLLGLVASAGVAYAQGQYDIVIANGTIIDGTGGPRYRGDIAITGDRVVRIERGSIPTGLAKRTIDARGLIVAPGFIDLHAHLDPLPQMPDAQSAVTQGVTLALGGPDGGGPWPFGPYLDSIAQKPLGINVAYLAGHNTIRRSVMGTANRAPTADELSRMQSMVAQSMRDGAFGLSTGLRYIPGFYSNTDEVVALSKVAADSGGIYTSHLREEGLGLFEGVAEALEIGRRARIPVVLTHHKAIGRQMWGKSVVTLAMVDSARKAGTDVMIDQYPYTASSTSLDVLVPPWALSGGNTELKKRLENPVLKDSITRGVIEYLLNDRGGGDIKRVQFSRVSWDHSLEGKTLYDWAVRRKVPTTPEGSGAARTRGRSEWRRVDGLSRDRRGGRQANHGAPDDNDRQRRPAREARRRRPAPARVRHVSACTRPLCTRRAHDHARAGGQQDDWHAREASRAR